MVLGLINFLLGGKKKEKVSRSGQVATPMNKIGGSTQNDVPNGSDLPTQNVKDDLEFKDLNKKSSEENTNVNNNNSTNNQSQNNFSNQGGLQRKSISDVIGKIHEELKSTNEKIGEVVSDIRSIENNVNTLGHRVDDLEEGKKIIEEKIGDIDTNMGKFLSLYELINNQYNPFVNSEKKVEKVEILADGSSNLENSINLEPKSFEDLNLKKVEGISVLEDDLDSSLLELDTLNIEEAAADAVPLTKLKNNTNSLVIILSWLEYLIKKIGIEETRNSLRYYTETLRWITPEVFFDLDKYLRGMKDRKELEEDAKLTVKDHIVSLYFISKLNEKTLDAKLTKAVIQIIKN